MERLKTLHKQGAISMAISDAHFERRLEELCDEDGATTAAADTADSAIDVERTTGDAASGKRAATGSPPVSPAKPKPIGDDDDDDKSGDDDSDSDDDDEEAPAKPQETVKAGLKRFKGSADGQEPAKSMAGELMSKKAPCAAIDNKERKPQVRKANTNGRGASKKRQGGRKHDVKNDKIIDQRVTDNPNGMLEKKGAIGSWNLYCNACNGPIGSSASDTVQHLRTRKHKTNLAKAQKANTNAALIKKSLAD